MMRWRMRMRHMRYLMAARGLIDLLIPRGGAGLIRACVDNAAVPVLETGTGICHIYVDGAADQTMALNIVENAKCSRPSVCNAAEVLGLVFDFHCERVARLGEAEYDGDFSGRRG